MTMDLEQLFEPKKVKFEALKVYNKLTKEVILIKSTRFNPAIHSMNIPSGAHENLDFNHPTGTIDLSTKAPEEPISVPDVKVDTGTVSEVETPVDDSLLAKIDTAIAMKEAGIPGASFFCSKGCGKLCTSKAGKASHERACKFVN